MNEVQARMIASMGLIDMQTAAILIEYYIFHITGQNVKIKHPQSPDEIQKFETAATVATAYFLI